MRSAGSAYRRNRGGLWLATLLFVTPAGVMAQSGTYSNLIEYPTPQAGSFPQGIVAGPDGAMWFAEQSGNIGRITTTGELTEYPVPTAGSSPWNITRGPDGALWFTEIDGNQIGRITTDGLVTEYPIPTSQSGPRGITRGPDSALWFVETLSNKIGRITTSGTITEFPITGLAGYAEYITTGPDGALWFTYSVFEGGSDVVRMTTSGAMTVYQTPGLPAGLEAPQQIVVGSDGALWFAESYGNIFRVTTDGVFTQYPVPLPGDGDPTAWIASGPDGALWFTAACNPCANAWVGRLTTSGVFTEFPVPPNSEIFGGIAAGTDGAVWYTVGGYGGRLVSSVGRIPACALGFSTVFANRTLTLNFDLGIDTAAQFNIFLKNSSGTLGVPFSKTIPAVVPPRPFALHWTNFPDLGSATVQPVLATASGQTICSEWVTVDTTP